ncbi:hypothetical protein FKG96_12250 [Olivibacter sp. LS-1]|uniref:hypothetical protein n=1 Tax=Olivibacter sp. LS-1 TaxID=2592345 RepID=UPI0011EB355E|nr:hypothetical protein [Olivibacter sp. LS-1]QEL01544.1 hypothetical protein FKG96_12250 [Olivibacter sp. LS-1]
MEISIDKNVPIPMSLSWSDKLDKLEIGDSIPVLDGSQETVRQTAWRNFHKPGTKFFTVREDPSDPKNYRVWRVTEGDFKKIRNRRAS